MLRTLCVLVLVGIGSIVEADTLPAAVTLSTVDQFDRQFNDMTFVGIVSGQSTASTFNVSAYDSTGLTGNTCERAALLMMSRPGRFQLLISPDDTDYGVHCRLIRLTQ